MQTDGFGPRPGDNFSVVRLSRDLQRGIGVGGFYFGRDEKAAAELLAERLVQAVTSAPNGVSS